MVRARDDARGDRRLCETSSADACPEPVRRWGTRAAHIDGESAAGSQEPRATSVSSPETRTGSDKNGE
jgi:hypothetical protein